MGRKKNIATVEELVDHSECEECSEDFLFLMKDNYHSFYLPMDIVFNCLQIASYCGCIPTLNKDWVDKMDYAGYTVLDLK